MFHPDIFEAANAIDAANTQRRAAESQLSDARDAIALAHEFEHAVYRDLQLTDAEREARAGARDAQ